jgi:hypothetical protein
MALTGFEAARPRLRLVGTPDRWDGGGGLARAASVKSFTGVPEAQ